MVPLSRIFAFSSHKINKHRKTKQNKTFYNNDDNNSTDNKKAFIYFKMMIKSVTSILSLALLAFTMLSGSVNGQLRGIQGSRVLEDPAPIDCDGPGIADKDTCECLKKNCSSQEKACMSDDQCPYFLQCLTKCAGDDSNCIMDCFNSNCSDNKTCQAALKCSKDNCN